MRDVPHESACNATEQGLKSLRQVSKRHPGLPHSESGGIDPLLYVSRALKQPGLWLTLVYVGLILLMARTYA
jgi:hypothetical protein